MRLKLISAAVPAAIAAVFAVTAFAAVPKKGANYVGEVKSSPFTMRVLVAVSATGKSVRFTYWCGTGRAPTVAFGIPLDATGHFKHTVPYRWKIAGHFTSATAGIVSLNAIACGGSKGSTALALK
jgi:hypothetical protein